MKWILFTFSLICSFGAVAEVEKFVRYNHEDKVQYGQLVVTPSTLLKWYYRRNITARYKEGHW
ncbi:hypothetical protein [Vibrio sp. F74]|uniref:hypothetical protein n=1 Tax=Vibrio sp. F74 TaxID=700020 RepID=UPI0035F5437A